MRRSTQLVAAVGLSGVLLSAVLGVASADQVHNNLDATVDATFEALSTNVGAPDTSVGLAIVLQAGDIDGKSGCNISGGPDSSLTVSVTSSDMDVATVSPTTLTFTNCGATPTITIHPVGAGTTHVTLAETARTINPSWTFDFTTAAFTVNVAAPAPANSAPSVSVTGVSNGGSYTKGSVPAAGCSVSDEEDGTPTVAPSIGAIIGPNAVDGIGSQTVTCSYTDGGGLTTAASATYEIVDASAPVITYVLSPSAPDGDNDWYTSDVALTWSVSEPDSPSTLTMTGCNDQSLTEDQAEQVYSCAASSAGGTAVQVDVAIKRDATPPTITPSLSPALPASNWYNNLSGAPTVTYGCDDALSLVATCTPPFTFGEGANQNDGGAVTDMAGNSASAGVSDVDVDLTDPGVSWNTTAFDGTPSFYFGFLPVSPTCTATDDLSGPKDCGVSGYSGAVGDHVLTATAHDNAANVGSDNRDYHVQAWTLRGFFQPVDMNGVLNTVKAGSTVPLKFEIFAGSTELIETSRVKSFTTKAIACPGASPVDEIEFTTTGGTSLRYDATGGQFIQNWQTPKSAGCHKVTMETQDGSKIIADFRLK